MYQTAISRMSIVGLVAALACNGPSIDPVGGRGGSGGATGMIGEGPDAAASTGTPPSSLPPVPDGGYPDTGAVSRPMEGQMSCAEDVQTAKLSPVDLLLLLDASGSMAEKVGARNRWEMAREALVSFLQDGRSAGLGIGLQLFPLHTKTCNDDGTCFLPAPGGCRTFSTCLAPNARSGSGEACGLDGDEPCAAGSTCTPLGRCSVTGGDCVGVGQPCPGGAPNDMCGARPRQCRLGPSSRGSCTVADYVTPAVPIMDIPGATARLMGNMDARLALGTTPLGPAIKGALTYLGTHMQSRPDRRTVLVIVSDGVPEGCIGGNDVATIAADLRAAAARTPALTTYMVGVFADNEPPEVRAAVDQIAMAGGAGAPFIVSPNEQLAEKFLGALNQIRGAALPCDLAIPKPAKGDLDFGKVNVRVTGTAGPVDLVYVGSRDRCAATRDGWYYDVDPIMATPARVHLCPAVCDRVKADAKASVELQFGCKQRVIL